MCNVSLCIMLFFLKKPSVRLNNGLKSFWPAVSLAGLREHPYPFFYKGDPNQIESPVCLYQVNCTRRDRNVLLSQLHLVQLSFVLRHINCPCCVSAHKQTTQCTQADRWEMCSSVGPPWPLMIPQSITSSFWLIVRELVHLCKWAELDTFLYM